MKKLIILVICVAVIIGIVQLASKIKSRDMTSMYLEHASFYGLKNLVDNDIIEEETKETYSHDDYKFWGIPEVN